MAHGHDQNDHQRGQRRGQGDPEIAPELILHGAALTVAGGDGGIGNEGQVVAEHGAAHDGADAKRQGEAGNVGNGDGDGHDQRDRAAGGAHGGGDKAGGDKQHSHRRPRGCDGEQEIRDRLRTGATGNADEHTGCQEDQDHRHDVLIAHALTHNGKLFVKLERPVLQARNEQRDQEHDHNGNGVKSHRDLHHVLKHDAKTEIQHQKYQNRQQRFCICLFLHCFFLFSVFRGFPVFGTKKSPRPLSILKDGSASSRDTTLIRLLLAKQTSAGTSIP